MNVRLFYFLIYTILFSGTALAECENTSTIKSGHYYWMSMGSKDYLCYRRYVYSDSLTVVTLKHKEGKGDFDLRVFADPGFQNKISSSTSTGAKSELLVLPVCQNSGYIYILVNNYEELYGKYEIYVHEINLAELAGEAFAVASLEFIAEAFISELFGVDDNSSSSAQNHANRAAVGLVSQLQGKSLSDTSESLLINEIRREFAGGNGFLSSFMTNFGVSLVNEIYLNY